MATPTQIEVSVDNTEYSRYEEGRETITATVTILGGAPYSAEDIRVDLVKARRSRDAVVATATLSFTSNVDPAMLEAVFYLPDIVDQDLIHLVRHGKYFVQATDVATEMVVGESADFDISIVTVDRLKSDFLYGIDLKATELKAPKFQPAVLPVTIVDVSKGHPLGFYSLTYNYSKDDTASATVDIGSGVDGVVTITADGSGFTGVDGNLYSVEVVVPAGTSALSAVLTGSDLVVSLDVTSGIPNAGANTATLVAAAIDTLPEFSAVASGTGATALSIVEGPTGFAGGESNIVRLLSWNGGTAAPVTSTGIVVLPLGTGSSAVCSGAGGRDYICVRIKSLLALPTSSITEDILIDRKTLDDATLRRFICEAVVWVEKEVLATPVEPTNVVTDRDPTTIQFAAGVNAPTPLFTDTDYDILASPLTYFVPRTQGSWVQIQMPWPQLLRVDSLFGSIANTRVIDIDLEWIEHTEQGGLVQLVPFNQEIAFDFVGLLWVNALRGATELPNFWHYNAIVGLRDAPCNVQEYIAKKAAINTLIVAGMALRPGVGSVSLSRDGVSESVSYTTSAQYGIYTGVITAYKEWLEEEERKMRAKYRGPVMIVV